MAHTAQTALLELVETYLQDLRQEAETLSTVARLLGQSMESRRAIMGELHAYFAAGGAETGNGAHSAREPQAQVHGSDQWASGPPPINGQAPASALVRDLDNLMAHPPSAGRAWPNGYHA